MTEDTSRHRRPPCQWIARDDEGRPRCEHGWASKCGLVWKCPQVKAEAQRRYAESEQARLAKDRWNSSEEGRESKRRYKKTSAGRSSALFYQATRIRIGR